MVLIILSWIYILFTTINLGFSFDKIMNLKNRDFIITSILGLFSVTVLASIWAIFGRINIEFNCFLFTLNLLILLKFKTEILTTYDSFINELKALDKSLKYFLILISIFIIAQCSSIPYVIDNESYYIQTIKWINVYGFVKGLANLHVFLGQTSGWHITQSAFNFSFLYKNFNDLSGFCLLLGTVFSVLKLNQYFHNSNKTYLIVGLFPLTNVFFFQLISAPSPDIPVYVFTFILFFYFIKTFKDTRIEDFNLIAVLVIFILYIKVTSLGLVFIPISILVFNYKELFKKLLPITFIGFVILSLFIIKNCIISGFPLFPTTYFRLSFLDFTISKDVASYYYNENRRYSFSLTSQEFNSIPIYQIALKWLFAPKINGYVNLLTIFVFTIIPFFITRYFNKKSFWILYSIILLQFIVLLFSSPVYRFFIHLTFYLSFLIFASWFPKKRFIMSAYAISTLITFVVLFLPMSYDTLTKNKLIGKNSNFSINNIIFPHGNSKLEISYIVVKKGNLKYYSPVNNSFLWGTGDGELPCVNKKQLDYFEKYFSIFPQLRTTNLKDGFYSKKVSPNE